MIRRFYWIAAAFLLVLVTAWWLTAGEPEDERVEKVRVAQTGDFLLYAGLYVAKDANLFARHGLDVSITSTGGDEKSAAAVLSGHADFAVGDPAFAAIANARGQDLRFFASLVNGAPFWGVAQNPTIASKYRADGLKGLRVATFPAPSTAYALQKEMYESQGAPVLIQEGAFGSLAGLVEAGRADIALELEPSVSIAQERGGIVLYSMAERTGPFAVTGVLTSARYAQSHPGTVASFCRALNEAFALIRSDPQRTQALLAKRFSEIPVEVITAAMKRVVSEGVIPASTAIDAKGWERALQLRVAVGDLPDVATGRRAAAPSLCPRTPASVDARG